MTVFECDNIYPQFVNLMPILSGEWLAYCPEGRSHNFVISVNKNPKDYFGYVYKSGKEISIISDYREPDIVLHSASGFSLLECVPHPEFFAGILGPRPSTKAVVIPGPDEVFRAALNIPEDKYSLIMSKKGGLFQVFELTVQSPAIAMPSCDGQTVLVVQNNLVTIFDNPLF